MFVPEINPDGKLIIEYRRPSVNEQQVSRHDGGGWTADRKRHVAVLWVGEEAAVDCFRMLLCGEQPKFRLRTRDEIPRDCDVVNVHHSWEQRAFGVLLFHESFAPVDDGAPAPTLTSSWSWEYVVDRPKERSEKLAEVRDLFLSLPLDQSTDHARFASRIMHDPLVRACMQEYVIGEMTREQALVLAVVGLFNVVQELRKGVVSQFQRDSIFVAKPSPIELKELVEKLNSGEVQNYNQLALPRLPEDTGSPVVGYLDNFRSVDDKVFADLRIPASALIGNVNPSRFLKLPDLPSQADTEAAGSPVSTDPSPIYGVGLRGAIYSDWMKVMLEENGMPIPAHDPAAGIETEPTPIIVKK